MPNDKRLGEMLVESGQITQLQFDSAMADQRSWGGNLGRNLVRMGAVSRAQLVDFLARKINVQKIDFLHTTVNEDAVKLIPREVCWRFKVLPIVAKASTAKKGLLLAMADPSDLEAIEQVEFLTGYRVTPVVGDEEQIEKIIEHCYSSDGYRSCQNGECLHEMIDLKPAAIDLPDEEQIVIMTDHGEEKVIQKDDRMVAFRGLRALVDLLIEKGIVTQEEFRDQLAKTE
ncbi:MAG: hypothetical protein P9M14_15325 [Candidatus Alcyoniella australis]|nr:hypothetical protein [Candidatus Alcyoniella australis]